MTGGDDESHQWKPRVVAQVFPDMATLIGVEATVEEDEVGEEGGYLLQVATVGKLNVEGKIWGVTLENILQNRIVADNQHIGVLVLNRPVVAAALARCVTQSG